MMNHSAINDHFNVNTGHKSPIKVENIPWKPTEIELLSNFLLSAKNRSMVNPEIFWNSTSIVGPTALNNDPGYQGSCALNERDKNLCVLKGQTGSGKQTATRLLCRQIGLRIIEYDPFESDISSKSETDGIETASTSLIRFLEQTRTKSGIKIASEGTNNGDKDNPTAGCRRLKYLKLMKNPNFSGNSYVSMSTNSYNDPHIILLTDLPRTLLNSKYSDSLHKIKQIIHTILNGNPRENNASDAVPYPLLICVNNSVEDMYLLKKMLPYNYDQHPRYLGINLTQVAKFRVKKLLMSHINGKGLGSYFNDLVDHIVNISNGDIRYALTNLRFYSSDITTGSHLKSDIGSIKGYTLQRIPSNSFFPALGKILYNKRVTTRLKVNSPRPGRKKTALENLNSIRIFEECLKMSKNLSTPRAVFSDYPRQYDGILSDYSDVLEMIPSIDSDIGIASSQSVDHEYSNKLAPNNGYFDSYTRDYSPYTLVFSGVLDESPLGELPSLVKAFGFLDDFDQLRPYSFTRWPVMSPDESEIPTRQSRGVMVPKLTRPQLYYNPDAIVEAIDVDYTIFVGSIFDHYVRFFGHIDDCATMCTQLSYADVINFMARTHISQSEENIDQLNEYFALICTRAACDSNLSGICGGDRQHGFYPLTKSTNPANIRHKIKRMKELYHSYRMYLHKISSDCDFTGEPLFPNVSSIYMPSTTVFVEVIPLVYMALAQENNSEINDCEQSEIPLLSSNVMTKEILERVDDIIQNSRNTSGMSTGYQNNNNMVSSERFGFLDTITSEFKELLTEISKSYVTLDNCQQIQVTCCLQQKHNNKIESS